MTDQPSAPSGIQGRLPDGVQGAGLGAGLGSRADQVPGAGLAAGTSRPGGAGGRDPVVGMIGAGQLARMTCQAAPSLAVRLRVLAAAPDESAAQVCAQTRLGDYRSLDDLRDFAAGCDVLTFDHEHVPGEHLRTLEQAGFPVRPGPAALRHAQDKLALRGRLASLGLPCPRSAPVGSVADVRSFAGGASGWPVVLKAVTGGYDGRGVWVCQTLEQAADVLGRGLRLIAEEFVAFDRELAVLLARSPAGQVAVYPVVQTVQRDGICREVFAPAPGLADDRAVEAQRLGITIAAELGVTGLLAVELFETSAGLLINELAMRPHNSGHWTIEGARTSQFEQHLRAVLDLPLGAPGLAAPEAVMVNVLGGADPGLRSRLTHVLAADPGIRVHLYGKAVRPGRKVGHVTALGAGLAGLADRARRAANYLATGSED
jgi:5-(carboxyamino)imidazole ribonucleotide synthase